jgi:hypothetical protein
VFTTIERKYISEELEHSFLKVWKYWHAKQSGKLVERTIEEEVGIEESIHHLGLNYFFVGVIKQPIRPPTVRTILVLWNREFNYYKEQPLESVMVKHKLEVGSSFRAKRMKSKMKDIDAKIQLALLDQIHFPTCMYITMWATKKEEHAWMIEAKLDDFYWFD